MPLLCMYLDDKTGKSICDEDATIKFIASCVNDCWNNVPFWACEFHSLLAKNENHPENTCARCKGRVKIHRMSSV